MNENSKKQVSLLTNFVITIVALIGVVVFGLLYFINNPEEWNKPDEIPLEEGSEENEKVKDTMPVVNNTLAESFGFVDDIGMVQVTQNCTQCHSAKLVTQNRLNEEGWRATIKWMQETQNLWDLGNNEEVIVAYLAKNYGPQSKGRRQKLTNVEWYALE
ncbi:MAG: monoheme cytochrome C [Bacteroidota bacterium]